MYRKITESLYNRFASQTQLHGLRQRLCAGFSEHFSAGVFVLFGHFFFIPYLRPTLQRAQERQRRCMLRSFRLTALKEHRK